MDSLAEPASSIDWNLSALAADRRCDTIQPSAEHVSDDGIDALNLASIQRCRRQNNIFAKRMVKNNMVKKRTGRSKRTERTRKCSTQPVVHQTEHMASDPSTLSVDMQRVFHWNHVFSEKITEKGLIPTNGVPQKCFAHFEFAGGGAAEVASEEAISNTGLIDIVVKTQSDWDTSKMKSLQANNNTSCKFRDIMNIVESDAINRKPEENVLLTQDHFLNSIGLQRSGSSLRSSSSSSSSSTSTSSSTSGGNSDDIGIELEHLQDQIQKLFDKKHCLTTTVGDAQAGWELLGSVERTDAKSVADICLYLFIHFLMCISRVSKEFSITLSICVFYVSSF